MDLPNSHHSPRAVVIEDDPEIRALHKQVLEPLGFEVILTSNAADGIAAVREFSPDITFLDVSMGGMDGFAAAVRLRSFSPTYIIMITALDSELDVVQGLNAGADDYVLKPFRPRELRARVEAMMRRPRPLAAHSETVAEQTNAALPHVTTPPVPEPEADLWRPGADRSTPYPAAAETTLNLESAQTSFLDVVPEEMPRQHALQPARIPQEPSFSDLDIWRSHRDLHLNIRTGIVRAFDQQIQLERPEAALLSALMDSGSRVRSTANLVLSLRGESYVTTYFVNENDKRAVLDHMESLRRKLGDTGPSPIWIEPVRGVGFRMTSV